MVKLSLEFRFILFLLLINTKLHTLTFLIPNVEED